jgi:hypothetical protein
MKSNGSDSSIETQLLNFGLGLAKLEQGIGLLAKQLDSMGSAKCVLNARTVIT